MILKRPGVRTQNWTLIPLGSGLFLPLNLHLNDFCHTLWGRAIAYKQASSECLEKRGLAVVMAPGRVSVMKVSLSCFILCTIPTHSIGADTPACMLHELLKVKSGASDIRQNSLWLWWNNTCDPMTCKYAECSTSTEKRVNLGVKIHLPSKICLQQIAVAKGIWF